MMIGNNFGAINLTSAEMGEHAGGDGGCVGEEVYEVRSLIIPKRK